MNSISDYFLLINPWPYDFAAFDLWAKPLGLLYLASLIRKSGYRVHLIDCTDRAHPRIKNRYFKSQHYGTGHYYSEEIPKPKALEWVPRRYKRYGIPREEIIKEFQTLPYKPVAILITSRMTYWYPGVIEMIWLCREHFQNTPVVLGGLYPTLTPDHARDNSGADIIFTGDMFQRVKDIFTELSLPAPSEDLSNKTLDAIPEPAYDLLFHTSTLPLLTSLGCPKACGYCASSLLFPKFTQRDPKKVVAEIIEYNRRYGTVDFAFYDDALMIRSGEHLENILSAVIEFGLSVRFHTPNGLDYRSITPEVAHLLYAAGCTTIRLSLESSNSERLSKLNRDADPAELRDAVANLKNAGFTPDQIGIYILAGLPGQKEKEVRESIDFVFECGAVPRIAEFSPILSTGLWKDAVVNAHRDITEEPLLHNNSVYHLISRTFEKETLARLREHAKGREQYR